ncbi:MAG: S8 family serine peptidase [Bdellovibrionales bacterium]|nr:S8 family serine peptidase [Bdellovibrionales bacterium]
MKVLGIILAAVFSGSLWAAPNGDILVKLASNAKTNAVTLQSRLPMGTVVEDLGVAGWVRVKVPAGQFTAFHNNSIMSLPGVLKVTPNHTISLMANWKVTDPAMRTKLMAKIKAGGLPGLGDEPAPDNPAIPGSGSGGSGSDPMYNKQWGMNQMMVKESWVNTKGNPEMVVAVIDTGVDYTHEDLVDNMWRNPGETGLDAQGRDRASNGIDDDGNGYIDDVVGWDFSSNDNKPYDLTASLMDMLMGGGNPGHGTHCAGNVAARSDNGKGIAGVAPNVRIMALRFISEKGQGTTADAIKAIKYAVDNGAKVMSNSWGSEGDDPRDPDTGALKDTIQMAQDRGVLFIAAAGNGHQGKGYDNDSDPKPAVPASYNHDIIVSVAALDESGKLGSFSNWGARSVDLGAPGVKVFSTVTQKEKYSDTVIDIPGMITATWDGTSMATPHVAGAAALYWSLHPEKNWREVKNAVLSSVKRNPVMNGKSTSGGQLDVGALMKF